MTSVPATPQKCRKRKKAQTGDRTRDSPVLEGRSLLPARNHQLQQKIPPEVWVHLISVVIRTGGIALYSDLAAYLAGSFLSSLIPAETCRDLYEVNKGTTVLWR